LPEWSRRDARIQIRTPHYAVVLDENAGGAIAEATSLGPHTALLRGPSIDLVSVLDSGGLWRMGFEFRGGKWREEARASDRPTAMEAQERDGALEVAWSNAVGSETIERRAWFRADSPQMHFRLTGRAPLRRTITVRFSSGLAAAELVMDAPGGVVSRPLHRVHSPTFWPFQRFVHIRDRASGRGLAIYQPQPGAVHCAPDGVVELVALRNAPRERAFGFLPLTGNPAKGIQKERSTFDFAIEFTAAGDWRVNDLARKAYAPDADAWADPRTAQMWAQALTPFTIDRPDVWVVACKPASRGEGRILRLYTLTAMGEPISVRLDHSPVREAFLCDARERDLQPLEIRDGRIHLTMPGTMASVRLLP
jgi:hypothetical protein